MYRYTNAGSAVGEVSGHRRYSEAELRGLEQALEVTLV